jgi:hypothetical protein
MNCPFANATTPRPCSMTLDGCHRKNNWVRSVETTSHHLGGVPGPHRTGPDVMRDDRPFAGLAAAAFFYSATASPVTVADHVVHGALWREFAISTMSNRSPACQRGAGRLRRRAAGYGKV